MRNGWPHGFPLSRAALPARRLQIQTFDPPPPRAPIKLTSDSPEDEEYYNEPEFLNLPAPPALPDRPWTKAEAVARFEQALKTFPKITQAFDYLIEMDYTLFQDLGEIAGDLL